MNANLENYRELGSFQFYINVKAGRFCWTYLLVLQSQFYRWD